MTKNTPKSNWVGKLYICLLLVIFGGIVLHAPLSVGLSTVWPHDSLLIKSWKEILLGIAVILLPILLTQYKRWSLIKDPLCLCIAAFAALNILLIPLFFTGAQATLAGILINLRYLLFFVLVYVGLSLYPQYIKLFIKVFIAGALIVLVFAILQATVLPHDILKYLGYTKETIAPYLTVDQNTQFIRINSTLRGPNPLGAYAMVVLVILLAFWLRGPKKITKFQLWVVGILGIGGVIALWASYSRSAVLGAIAALALVILVAFGKRITKKVWVILGVIAIVVAGSLVVFKDTNFISNVVLHTNPSEGNNVNSDNGHAASLIDGTKLLIRQPLGKGIGSTGSASLMTDSPIIIENQYLFVAHETGWLGLALFMVITIVLLVYLWRGRKDWFVLGVFASGVGLAVIGLLLPVWVDETVALIWWGLAGIALVRTRSGILLVDNETKK